MIIYQDTKSGFLSGIAENHFQARIDVLLAGSDGRHDNGLIIELKAWDTAKASPVSDMVLSPIGGGTVKQHPCLQARQYKGMILRFNQDILEKDIRLHPSAYLFNLYSREISTT